MILNEDQDIHLYKDSNTGDVYYYNGKELVKLNSNRSKTKKNIDIGSQPEDDEEDRQIKEREDAERQQNDITKRSEEDNKSRIDKIDKMLNDEETSNQINDETEKKVFKSRQTKNERERAAQKKQYSDSHGLEGFIISLNGFIKNELKEYEVRTYKKINRSYNSNAGSSIIRQGKMKKRDDHIPLINVYFDRSGSWSESDTAIGRSAIATLNKYVDKGLLKIDIYYFANRVSDRDDGSAGGGTYGQPIVNHIEETRPDNVIIMTDSDITDISTSITVKGGCWFLWKNGLISENLRDHIKGKKLTKEFIIRNVN